MSVRLRLRARVAYCRTILWQESKGLARANMRYGYEWFESQRHGLFELDDGKFGSEFRSYGIAEMPWRRLHLQSHRHLH